MLEAGGRGGEPDPGGHPDALKGQAAHEPGTFNSVGERSTMKRRTDVEPGENTPGVEAVPTRKPWTPPRVIASEVEVETEGVLDEFGPHRFMAS